MQVKLNDYFKSTWTPRFSDYTHSGYSLIEKIKDTDHVLDVGCGDNPFKGKIENLIGIDPVFPQADITTTIEDFDIDQKFDVALCLDSLIFGNCERVLYQLSCVVKHLKPSATIHFRTNNEIDLIEYKNAGIQVYEWSQTEYVDFAGKFGFEFFILHPDTHNSAHGVWVR